MSEFTSDDQWRSFQTFVAAYLAGMFHSRDVFTISRKSVESDCTTLVTRSPQIIVGFVSAPEISLPRAGARSLRRGRATDRIPKSNHPKGDSGSPWPVLRQTP